MKYIAGTQRKTLDVISMTWQETLVNGVPRRTPTPTILAFIVEATTAAPAATQAIVSTAVRPTATATIRLALLYTCSPERLSAMHL